MRGDERRLSGVARTVLAWIGAILLLGGSSVTSTMPVAGDAPGPATPLRPDPVAGVVEVGLERVQAGDVACGGYPYRIVVSSGAVACSHGPDPAPAGIDVRQRPSVDSQWAAVAAGGGTQAVAAGGTVPCVGYGTSGKRVVALYAHPAGSTSRYAEIAPLIGEWAGQADDIFDVSAGQTGGSRHLRWAHDADCNVTVQNITLSASAVSSLNAMHDELWNMGYNRADRRYVVWFDVNYLCGVALNTPDDRPGQDNQNNGAETGFVHFARIDNGCWGVPAPDTLVESHEIMHTIGAVQWSSPYTSSLGIAEIYGHCIDEWDAMCYADGTPKALLFPCAASNDRYFDCNHNDYFHTHPPAGSYLDTHWNTADSAFLVKVDPVAGFVDLGGSGFGEHVAWASETGITVGCSSSGELFCPNDPVTRGQMAAFLSRALALPGTGTDFFTDDSGSSFQLHINRLAAAGIATGCNTGGTRFCPNDPVSRGQMAAFLDRAFDPPGTTNDYFGDDEGSIFEDEINRVTRVGIASGCSSTRFCPTNLVTRAQMTAFLHRALD